MNEQDKAKEYLKGRTNQRGDNLVITRNEAISALADFAKLQTADLEADLLQNIKWLHEAEKKLEELNHITNEV